MAKDNYPTGFNETSLEDPLTEIRDQVEARAHIVYELHVWVDGELIAYKKTINSDGIADNLRAADNLVSKKIDELAELRAEELKEAISD